MNMTSKTLLVAAPVALLCGWLAVQAADVAMNLICWFVVVPPNAVSPLVFLHQCVILFL